MEIKRNTIIYLLGELASRAIPFLLMPYLSRSLGAEGYGFVSLYQAWIAFAIIIISYLQEASLIRYIHYYGRRSASIVTSAGFLFSTLISSVIIIILIILNQKFFCLVVITAYFSCLLKVRLSYWQAIGEAENYVRLQFLFSFLSVTVSIFLIEIFKPIAEYRVIGIVISNIACLIFFKLYYGSFTTPSSISNRKIKLGMMYILSFSTPLLFNSLSSVLKGHLDRVIFPSVFSVAELGIYSVSIQIASVLLILVIVFSRALEPYCYSRLKSGRWGFETVRMHSIYFAIFLCVVYFAFLQVPSYFYDFLLGGEFGSVKVYVDKFILSYLFIGCGVFYSLYLSYYGRTGMIMKSNMFSLIFYVLFLYVFSKYGPEYMPYASIISNVVLLMSLYCLCLIYSKREHSV